MNKVYEIKPLADRFARYWCYDWVGGRRLLEGKVDSVEKIESDLYEVRTSTWAIDLETANLELSKEIHRLTTADLQMEFIRGGMGDVAPGEFVDFEQSIYPILTDEPISLETVPERVLKAAVESYCSETDFLWDFYAEDDPFAFVIPQSLHPTVTAVLERLCREKSKELTAEDAAYRHKIRQFILIIETDPPFQVESGKKVEFIPELVGKGIILLNGMPDDSSPSSHVRASGFKKWVDLQVAGGHLVFPVKGVSAGNAVDGVLAVAVFDISRNEAEVAVRSASTGFGLYIGGDFMPQFIRR